MKRPTAARVIFLAGSVTAALVAAVPAFASTYSDSNYSIYVSPSGTQPTDPIAGTFTFADSGTFAGYSGGPLVIAGVATITGGATNEGTNPGTGYSGGAGISNWIAAPSTITITFDSLTRDFGLLWGSIDVPNTVTFYNGATAIDTVTGADIEVYGGALGYPNAGSFVNFAALGAADDFTSVVLSDPGACCFEVDNFATNTSTTSAVPEPATVAVMVGGGLLLGWAARRRRARG
jgi:hypothetical protein